MATPSLLDRLCDDAPGNTRDAYVGEWEQRRRVRATILRDLTALLNVRRRAEEVPPEFEQARATLLTFGILDLTSLNLRDPIAQSELERSIESAIRQFEPRLTNIAVLLDVPKDGLLTLRCSIDAMLRTDSDPVPLHLDAVARADTLRFEVSGENE